MIKVSHKELKEIQKRKKKDEGEIAEEGPRLTGEKISHLEERELTLMKQLKSENDKKLSEPDAKFCICQRVAKSVSWAVLYQKAKTWNDVNFRQCTDASSVMNGCTVFVCQKDLKFAASVCDRVGHPSLPLFLCWLNCKIKNFTFKRATAFRPWLSEWSAGKMTTKWPCKNSEIMTILKMIR